jgi:hypothetical protein
MEPVRAALSPLARNWEGRDPPRLPAFCRLVKRKRFPTRPKTVRVRSRAERQLLLANHTAPSTPRVKAAPIYC